MKRTVLPEPEYEACGGKHYVTAAGGATDNRCFGKVIQSGKQDAGNGTWCPVTVLVKFIQSGSFNAGVFKSLDLALITKLQITRQRSTCELVAHTPENPQPNAPYILARRDRSNQLEEIMADLQQLKQGKADSIYEITDSEAHRIQ